MDKTEEGETGGAYHLNLLLVHPVTFQYLLPGFSAIFLSQNPPVSKAKLWSWSSCCVLGEDIVLSLRLSQGTYTCTSIQV